MSLLAPPVARAADPAEVQQQIEKRLTEVRARGGLYLRGLAIATGELLPEIYAGRGYAPIWTDIDRVDELLKLLETASAHGLDPGDYYVEPLTRLRTASALDADPALAADLDILYTESLIRFGYHQRFGKVNPTRIEPTWNFGRQFRPGQDPQSVLTAALAAPSLQAYLAQWIRRVPLYGKLQEALEDYRSIAERGGWPVVPDGPTLKPGARDPRVPVLRQRLAIEGDLAGGEAPPADADLYDSVVAGVRAFQQRHGMDGDGVLGPRTLAELNVPVEQRIDQLRLTLERARWVLDDTKGDFVLVNIAGFEVWVARDGRPSEWRRAVVGRAVRQTPIFRATMTHLVLNPTWTVPPTILKQDVLPKVRADRSYLVQNRMKVVDGSGRIVDPASVDWSSGRFPYLLRQDPGPTNSLGRIKFMFPNEHAVFLHDTPSKNLFDKEERLFSSGCIRVEDPLGLAEILLDDPARWNRASLQAAIDANDTLTLNLKKRWPVLVLYWTAELDQKGRVRFLRDVYQRDAGLLAALDGPVRIDFPDVPLRAAAAVPR